ncbi:MAG TPA: hypothetical protein GYA04_02930 [Acholeplasma sp.]|nr:hypothetical protein [Acholeplasma sp.]
MKNITHEIALNHKWDCKIVEVTEEFQKIVENFKEGLSLYYKNNPDFPITELTEIENKHMDDNGFPPESEKIHEYAREKIMEIANDDLVKSHPYTYVDEFNQYGGDEADLIVAAKLDVRYYEYKKIIDDIIKNNLQSNIWQIIENKTKNNDEDKLSKIDSNAVAAMIVFDEIFYNL